MKNHSAQGGKSLMYVRYESAWAIRVKKSLVMIDNALKSAGKTGFCSARRWLD